MRQKQGITSQLFLYWLSYKSFIQQRTSDKRPKPPLNIDDWRSRLFTNFITYVLPSCFIALIPGVYMAMKDGHVFVGVVDILTVVLIAAISLSSWFSQHIKKVVVIFILYCLSVVLLMKLSIVGPGFVYLLSLSVIVTVTCKIRLAYLSVILNFLVCIVCAMVIHYQVWDSPLANDYSLGVWIAVSSNLIFLSFVIVMLVGKTITGLEKTITKEQSLKTDLHKSNLEQFETNNLLKESEGHYKSLFFQSPTPMWILDIDTLCFLQVNEAAIDNYMYSEEEFLGMNVIDIKFDSTIDIINKDIKKSRETGNSQTLFTRHRKKNGAIFHVEVIFNTIPFNGKSAMLAISNDLTERVDYLKSIQLQNEKLQQIAWIQSHEVRAPLASILGLTQLYADDLTRDEIGEIMQKITDAAEELDLVIRETVAQSNRK